MCEKSNKDVIPRTRTHFIRGNASFNASISFLRARTFYSAHIFSPPKCFCLNFFRQLFDVTSRNGSFTCRVESWEVNPVYGPCTLYGPAWHWWGYPCDSFVRAISQSEVVTLKSYQACDVGSLLKSFDSLILGLRRNLLFHGSGLELTVLGEA